MTKKQQQLILSVVLGAVAALAAAYFLAVQPKLAERNDNLAAAAAAEQRTALLRNELTELEAKKQALPQAEKQVAALTRKFPNEYQQDDWFRMVLSVADRAGVEVTTITPSEPTGPGTDPAQPQSAGDAGTTVAQAAEDTLIAESSISVAGTGSPGAITRFVAGLEGMERPLLVDEVKFSQADGAGAVTISGKTFLSRALTAPPTAADQ